MWFKRYSIFMSCKGMHGRTDSHRDYSAHLRVVDFFSLWSSSRRIQYTFITIKTQKISKRTEQILTKKNSIEIAIFKFTDLIRFRIIDQLTAFFSLSDEPWFYLCMALAVGVTEIMNTATIAMLRSWAIATYRAILKVFSAIPTTMPYLLWWIKLRVATSLHGYVAISRARCWGRGWGLLSTHNLIEIWRQTSKKHNCKANIPDSERSRFFSLGRLSSSSASNITWKAPVIIRTLYMYTI